MSSMVVALNPCRAKSLSATSRSCCRRRSAGRRLAVWLEPTERTGRHLRSVPARDVLTRTRFSPSAAPLRCSVACGGRSPPAPARRQRNAHPADSKTAPIRPGRSRRAKCWRATPWLCSSSASPGASRKAATAWGRRGRTTGSRTPRARRRRGRGRWRAAVGRPPTRRPGSRSPPTWTGGRRRRRRHRRPRRARASPGRPGRSGTGSAPGPGGGPTRGRTRPRPARGASRWRPGTRRARCRRPRSSWGWPVSAGARAARRPRGPAHGAWGRGRLPGRRRRRRCARRLPRSRPGPARDGSSR